MKTNKFKKNCLLITVLFLYNTCMTEIHQIEHLPGRNKETEAAKIYITHLGTACFLIENNAHRILIDPGDFFTNRLSETLAGNLPEPDLILITHNDFDHCNRLEFIQNANKIPVIGTQSVKNDFPLYNVITDEFYTDSWISVDKIDISHGLRPDEDHTGYSINFAGKKIIFLGDGSKLIDELDPSPDILFVTIGGIEANVRNGVHLVKELKPLYVIPMHWEIMTRNAVRAGRFEKKLNKENTDTTCIIPEIYERFSVD